MGGNVMGVACLSRYRCERMAGLAVIRIGAARRTIRAVSEYSALQLVTHSGSEHRRGRANHALDPKLATAPWRPFEKRLGVRTDS